MNKLEELIQKLCPNGVEYKTIEEIFGTITDYTAAGSFADIAKNVKYNKEKDYALLVRTMDLKSNFTKGDLVYINEHAFNYLWRVKLDQISLVLPNIGNCGEIYYVDPAELPYENCSLAPNAILVRNTKENIRYLYHLMQTSIYLNQLEKITSSTGQTKFNKTDLKKIRIPVPPMEVQCEIVHILDQFTLLTAELTAELTARKEQYNCYRNKLIDEVVGKKGKLIELLIQPVTDGPHTTPKLYKEGVPFVSATAVYDGKVHLNDMKGYISKEFDEECSKKYKPNKFDVYMVKSGSTTGKVAIVDFDADFNIWSPLAAFRTGSETQSWYLYHLLQTSNVQEQVLSRMSQGSQPNLSMRVIEQFDVIIPSIDEQERIVNILNKFDTYCNDLTQGLPAEIELRKKQYEYYRDKLLTFKELEV